MRRYLIALVAAFAALTGNAYAQSCYLGASAGAQVAQIKVEGVTLAENGLAYGLLGGCNIALDKLEIGGRALYDWNNTKGVAGAWQAAAILGWRLNEHVKPYALLGYTGTSFKLDDVNLKHHGLVLGAGLEIAVAANTALIAEYNRVHLNAKTIDDVKLDPGAHVFRVGVTYKLF